ncbi:MAG: UDP-N-acetylmuramate--L-alanine ligase [Lachnospiraceae bacterium]|nr:UDP-N-acetylmuramate--L-alanine ligase [Lachnospiraceae bacterium]
MYNVDFDKIGSLRIHFIGIGGISMSGLAKLLLFKGAKVSGSDRAESDLTKELIKEGALINYDQSTGFVPEGTDVVVASAAIAKDNPEILTAEKRGIPVITRAELLGQVMKLYDLPVSVAGTHGKTTTTSMITQILLDSDCDPTSSIGGILPSIGGNFRIGSDKYFIMEACEYTNSFLSFFPKIAVILNIDSDHLDFFKDLNDIRKSFAAFAKLLPDDGTLIMAGNIKDPDEITGDLKCRIVTFGINDGSDISARDISYDETGCASFTVNIDGTDERFALSVPGEHNVFNACAAIAAARILGISCDKTREALRTFSGTGRRFEFKGKFKGATVIDDYAHHPTEIRATLLAAKKYPHNRIRCIFQPHTYSRTKLLLDDFADALSLADEVILADIYAARETDDLGISSLSLKEKLDNKGVSCRYFPDFSGIEKYISENCINGDLLITMGAGNVVKIGEDLLKD